MVYYLKINRNEQYTIKNLTHWLKAISHDKDAEVFVVCDSEKVLSLVQNVVDEYETKVIGSITDNDELNDIVHKIADSRWEKAAYAHLTTFFHARDNGYSEYWNIDADDTLICLNADRTYECLMRAREYALIHGMEIFSMDMWCSRGGNNHWSFGITYTKDPCKWINIIERYSSEDYNDKWQPDNVDGRFTTIRRYEEGIGTFYFENMAFVHYSNDFFRRPWASGMFKWKENRLLLPVLKDIFGISSMGDIAIPDAIVRLDIGIADDEIRDFMIEDCYIYDREQIRNQVHTDLL